MSDDHADHPGISESTGSRLLVCHADDRRRPDGTGDVGGGSTVEDDGATGTRSGFAGQGHRDPTSACALLEQHEGRSGHAGRILSADVGRPDQTA